MSWLLAAFSSLKFGKILLSCGTMLLSVFAYGWVFGLNYAIGVVLLILAHEMGHYIAAKQRKLDVGLPTFIPFVGAWIALKDQPRDAETEAYVGLAGPAVGTVAALLCYFVARETHSELLLAVAYAGLMLNLFNLLPLSPLDGGRITAVISRRIWWVGVPLLAALFYYTHSPVLLLVALLAVPHLIAASRSESPAEANYYMTATGTRFIYAFWYLGLAGLLGTMSYSVHRMLG